MQYKKSHRNGAYLKSISVVFFALLSFGYGAGAWDILPDKAPVPAGNPMTEDKIKLGQQLFFDGRLSINGKISCNTCHNVMGNGADHAAFSKGHDGKFGGRNSPTVWNSAFWSVQFWDGRAATLEDQAKGPLTNPVEMGMPNHDSVVEKVRKIPGYVEQFARVFGGKGPESVTIDHLAQAIATYERTLLTPNSPYDKYLKGDKSALSAQALKGMTLVKSTGCTACHSGPHFAGPVLPTGTGFYMKFPTFVDNAYEKKYEFSKDLGRFQESHVEGDKHFFRVMSWRNISETGPYFHNGAVKSLDEAVRVMAKVQLNKDLKSDEVEAIVAFLKSLKGEFPPQTAPQLPH